MRLTVRGKIILKRVLKEDDAGGEYLISRHSFVNASEGIYWRHALFITLRAQTSRYEEREILKARNKR